MAIRFDQTSDYYSSTASLPSADFTITCWAQISVNRSTYSTIWSINGGTGNYVILQTLVDGVTLTVQTQSSAGDLDMTGAVATVGGWVRTAVTKSGNSVTFYSGTETGAITQPSPITIGTLTPASFTISCSTMFLSEWLNGRIANLKHYSVALTPDEILTEWAHYVPSRVNSLVRWHPFITADVVDYSGNGNALTPFGVAGVAQDGPPISWADDPPIFVGASAVTQTGTATLAATATIGAAGFVTTSSGASLAATATIVATGLTSATTGAALAATDIVTAAGAVTEVTGASLTGTAAVTTAGAVTEVTGATLAGTATVTTAGALTAVSGASLAATATVTTVGFLSLASAASLAGTATVTAASGGVTLTGATAVSTSATVAAAGFLTLTSGASLAGAATITTVGVPTTVTAAAVAVTATVTTAGFLVLVIGAALTGSAAITPAGLLTLVIGAALGGTATITAVGTVPVLWGPPTGFTTTPISDTQINLSWNAMSGASGYDIERDGSVIATDVAGTSYSDTGLTPASTHNYRARSVRA